LLLTPISNDSFIQIFSRNDVRGVTSFKNLLSVQRFGDDWPSSDSDDPDYKPDHSRSDTDVDVAPCKNKCRRRKPIGDKVVSVHHNACTSSDSDTTDGDLWGKCIPHLVLLKIFHHVIESAGAAPFLCRAQQVCRLWYECASSCTLWKSVDLSFGWITANDATLQLLCETRFSKLTDINLSNWKLLTASGLKLLADTCPQLKSINLSYCRVNSAGVLYMINKCSNLTDIDLTSYYYNAAVNGKMFVHIVNKCSANLRSLNLSRNSPKGFSAVLRELAICCPNLECLDLSQNANCLIPFSFDIERLQHGCPRLRILRLVNANIEPARASLHDRDASPGFPELRELSLGFTDPTTIFIGRTGILYRLVKTSTKLKLLDLRGWPQLTCADLQSLPATDLAELYISRCSVTKDEVLEILVAKWQHSLVELDVSWNNHSEAALDMAARCLAGNPSTSKLEVLNLGGTQISLGSVQRLLQGCPALHNLNLSSCRSLPRGIKREYFSSSLDHLRQNIASSLSSDVCQ